MAVYLDMRRFTAVSVYTMLSHVKIWSMSLSLIFIMAFISLHNMKYLSQKLMNMKLNCRILSKGLFYYQYFHWCHKRDLATLVIYPNAIGYLRKDSTAWGELYFSFRGDGNYVLENFLERFKSSLDAEKRRHGYARIVDVIDLIEIFNSFEYLNECEDAEDLTRIPVVSF